MSQYPEAERTARQRYEDWLMEPEPEVAPPLWLALLLCAVAGGAIWLLIWLLIQQFNG